MAQADFRHKHDTQINMINQLVLIEEALFIKAATKRTLEAKGITCMGELIKYCVLRGKAYDGRHKFDLEKIPPIVGGYRMLDREFLGDIFDQDKHRRDSLGKAVKETDIKIKLLRKQRRDSIEDYEEGLKEIQATEKELERLKAEFNSIPSRNTLPPEIFHLMSVDELQDKGFIEPVKKEVNLFARTEKGKTIWHSGQEQRDRLTNILRQDGDLSAELIEDSWKEMRECLESFPLRTWARRTRRKLKEMTS